MKIGKMLLSWCLPLFTVLACGEGGGNGGNSELDWAHTQGSQSSGSIAALLAYKELGFRSELAPVRVCVQESSSYRGAALLLEVKLAYAAWLEASGRGSAQSWDNLDFSVAPYCDLRDTSYASVVIVASAEKGDKQQNGDFTPITCSERSCLPNAFTTGWGGPGTVRYTYNTATPSIWNSVSLSLPAMARLSPFIQWESLESEWRLLLQELAASNSSAQGHLDASIVRNLLDSYLELKAKSRSVAYEDLVALNLKLAKYRVASEATYRIVNARTVDPSPLFQQQMAGFHTLLHEVGHQFGMKHAHVKDSGADNGAVQNGKAVQRDGFWLTDDATMAYQNSYFYLSSDDRAGIQDMSRDVYAFLRAKRGI